MQRELRRFLGDLRLHQRRVVTLARANYQVFPAIHLHADRMIEPVRLERLGAVEDIVLAPQLIGDVLERLRQVLHLER